MSRRVTRGGMQSSGSQYTIYCPVCHKPAFKKETLDGMEIYSHFGKKQGVIQHKKEVVR